MASKPNKSRPEGKCAEEKLKEEVKGRREPPREAPPPEEAPKEDAPREETPKEEVSGEKAPPGNAPAPEEDESERKLRETEDKFLRLCAEFDNYRKRTAREKENTWQDAKVQTVSEFLPVYDNLERALRQESADEAYAKGVEMTMKGLRDVLAKLGVETIPALGETFDPKVHNAVMHVDDEGAGENTIVEVFQQGFTCGDRVIRCAMVKVAN